MPAPKLTLSARQEIARRYLAGEKPPLLAREYGISRCHVYAITHRLEARRQHASAIVAGNPETWADLVQRELLTASDAAALLGISRFTMHEYLQAGKFPGAFQIGTRGRFWLVPRVEVECRRRAAASTKPAEESR